MTGRIIVDGSPFYMHGTNYPWMVKNGKSNYGCDFGRNAGGIHSGVTTHLHQVEQDLATMQSLGFNTLRWFVFTDGRGGIRFDERNMPVELADYALEDMDAAVAVAHSHSIKIIFVLLDFLWMHDLPQPDSPLKANYSHLLRSEFGHDELISRIFHPLFQHFADHPAILAWEVMNEPDWVIAGLDPDRKKVREPISLSMFKSFVQKVSVEVHRETSVKVTVGGGRIKYANVWDDEALQLDFLQVHAYNDFLNHPWDGTLFGRRHDELSLKRPLLIGEFSTNARSAFSHNIKSANIPLEEYLDFSLRNDYAGCLYWSFNNVDKCGMEDQLVLRDWAERNSFA